MSYEQLMTHARDIQRKAVEEELNLIRRESGKGPVGETGGSVETVAICHRRRLADDLFAQCLAHRSVVFLHPPGPEQSGEVSQVALEIPFTTALIGARFERDSHPRTADQLAGDARARKGHSDPHIIQALSEYAHAAASFDSTRIAHLVPNVSRVGPGEGRLLRDEQIAAAVDHNLFASVIALVIFASWSAMP